MFDENSMKIWREIQKKTLNKTHSQFYFKLFTELDEKLWNYNLKGSLNNYWKIICEKS